MLKKRPFIRIILIFVLTLTVLILVYPVFRETYLGFIIKTGNRYMNNPGKDVLVKFRENEGNKDLDLVLYIGNSAKMKKDIKSAYYLITKASTFYIAWIGLALMMALILASPVPALRKLIVLVVGFLFVHVIVYLKLLVQVYYVCNHNPGLEILMLTPSRLKFFDLLQDQFVDTVQPTLILVVITWMLITFRANDYKKLMSSQNHKA
jgi:hypothetical protein